MRQYKTKKVWLNTKKTKHCWVRLFASKLDMQQYYKDYSDERDLPDTGHFEVNGVSLHYEKICGRKLSPETGQVLLCFQHCGAGTIAHELLHAVLWAYKHKMKKKQYPIIINNMKEEEAVLHNLTFALSQFYTWFWKIEKYFTPTK